MTTQERLTAIKMGIAETVIMEDHYNAYRDRRMLCDALEVALEALECNITFHRLGGIDDCEPCKAKAKIDEIMRGQE